METTLKPTQLPFWHDLFRDNGFESPFFRNYGTALKNFIVYRKYPFQVTLTDNIIHEEFPSIVLSLLPENFAETGALWGRNSWSLMDDSQYAQTRDSEEIDHIIALVEALNDPSRLVFCVGISWAGGLVEFLMKHPEIYDLCPIAAQTM